MLHESNFQGNHSFLLGHVTEEEHTREVLQSLDIKLINHDVNMRELTIEYSAQAMRRFFKDYVDGQGKKINPDKPIIPAVFWGKQFVAKAWEKSKDAEGALIQKMTVEGMKSQRRANLGRVESVCQRKLSEVEQKIGELNTGLLSVPVEQKEMVEQQLASEKLLLEGLVREKVEKIATVRCMPACGPCPPLPAPGRPP